MLLVNMIDDLIINEWRCFIIIIDFVIIIGSIVIVHTPYLDENSMLLQLLLLLLQICRRPKNNKPAVIKFM